MTGYSIAPHEGRIRDDAPVDKPGCGDSEGGPWTEIDFMTELDGYRQGLKALKASPFVDPEHVFLFGHSMGGVMAPLLSCRGEGSRRCGLRHGLPHLVRVLGRECPPPVAAGR